MYVCMYVIYKMHNIHNAYVYMLICIYIYVYIYKCLYPTSLYTFTNVYIRLHCQ